jgi:hypothetical protein
MTTTEARELCERLGLADPPLIWCEAVAAVRTDATRRELVREFIEIRRAETAEGRLEAAIQQIVAEELAELARLRGPARNPTPTDRGTNDRDRTRTHAEDAGGR